MPEPEVQPEPIEELPVQPEPEPEETPEPDEEHAPEPAATPEGEEGDPEPEEAPATPEEKPATAGPEVDEDGLYNGWTIAPHGASLYEEVFEQPDSDAAKAYKEEVGAAEYAAQRIEYREDKRAFEEQSDTAAASAVTKASPAFMESIAATKKTLSEEWLPGVDAGFVNTLTVEAGREIENYRGELVQQLVEAGVPEKRALTRVDAHLLAVPDLYDTAVRAVMLQRLPDVLKALRGEAVEPAVPPVTAPATPPKTPREPAAPTRPEPRAMTGGRGGAAPANPGQFVTPTETEKAEAQRIGCDPMRLAQKRAANGRTR